MKALSVAEAASLCGVGHNTVGYWIRTKKLRAIRNGKNYLIPREELLFFLKTSGREIPASLANDNALNPLFRSCQSCWEYWKGSEHGKRCSDCIVLDRKVEECFSARETTRLRCEISCNRCRYYREIYLPRIQFIHQFDFPAAVYKEFHLWNGNQHWADLCGVEQERLLGMGMERVFHPDSLETVISNAKRRKLGDPGIPRSYDVFLRGKDNTKIDAKIYVFPLQEPAGTYLILSEPKERPDRKK